MRNTTVASVTDKLEWPSLESCLNYIIILQKVMLGSASDGWVDVTLLGALTPILVPEFSFFSY